ncbi:MAG: Cof-type HAD-IIB family hydrolase [Aeriscardovia sp.]|nr:Cof-type HAD-IIB family hydrolase [Aeriscardovia sp.]
MDNQQEIFPIVDESGKVTGSATRGECHSGSKLLHPVVHLHVFNSKGDIYLQRRPDWKDIQPGKWDTAVGGHIGYGETPEEALRREVREELDITDFIPEFVDKYVFESNRERELVYVNKTTYDGEIRPSKEELDGGRFWTLQEIREAMGKDILTPNFESEFRRCFGKELGIKYSLFFDIDGTLVSFKTHEIPASTIFALTQAKANGHKVFISTGRPPLIITNLGAIEHLIDGYVTINGALCFVGNEIVRCKDIPKEAVMTVTKDAQEKNYGLIVVGEKDVAVLDPHGEVDRIFRGELAVENLNLEKPLDAVLRQRILQLTPFFPEEYERDLMERIPSCTSGRWHPAFTDITAKGADKGEGILALTTHLGQNPQFTMAFGDGGNDISMIKAAGIGIAMGNALESLKNEADYTTTSVDNDGVLGALQHYGLI